MSALGEQELQALMLDLESDRVERTASTKKKDKFCRAICAFANDLPGHGQPGYLLVGVHDDGRPSGLEVTDELLLDLGGLRTDGIIQPIPSMTVTKAVLPEGEIRYYWFHDRVEIQSPGSLYGDATPENFPDRNDYRNPVLAEAMKVLGYVNKYGRGVVRAQAELQRNGNPEATFHFDPSFVQVTIRAAT